MGHKIRLRLLIFFRKVSGSVWRKRQRWQLSLKLVFSSLYKHHLGEMGGGGGVIKI